MNKYGDNIEPKKQKPPKVLEIRFHKNIAEHDLHIKYKKIEDALKKGNHVKLRLQLMGREKAHPQQAVAWLTDIAEKFAEYSTLNRQPTPDNLVVILFPKKRK